MFAQKTIPSTYSYFISFFLIKSFVCKKFAYFEFVEQHKRTLQSEHLDLSVIFFVEISLNMSYNLIIENSYL